MLRQLLPASFRGIFLHGARRQLPGEHRQHDQTTGQAALPVQLPFNRVGPLFGSLEAFVEVIHSGRSSLWRTGEGAK